MRNQTHDEALEAEAAADHEWWQRAADVLGMQVSGWTYRSVATFVRLATPAPEFPAYAPRRTLEVAGADAVVLHGIADKLRVAEAVREAWLDERKSNRDLAGKLLDAQLLLAEVVSPVTVDGAVWHDGEDGPLERGSPNLKEFLAFLHQSAHTLETERDQLRIALAEVQEERDRLERVYRATHREIRGLWRAVRDAESSFRAISEKWPTVVTPIATALGWLLRYALLIDTRTEYDVTTAAGWRQACDRVLEHYSQNRDVVLHNEHVASWIMAEEGDDG